MYQAIIRALVDAYSNDFRGLQNLRFRSWVGRQLSITFLHIQKKSPCAAWLKFLEA